MPRYAFILIALLVCATICVDLAVVEARAEGNGDARFLLVLNRALLTSQLMLLAMGLPLSRLRSSVAMFLQGLAVVFWASIMTRWGPMNVNAPECCTVIAEAMLAGWFLRRLRFRIAHVGTACDVDGQSPRQFTLASLFTVTTLVAVAAVGVRAAMRHPSWLLVLGVYVPAFLATTVVLMWAYLSVASLRRRMAAEFLAFVALWSIAAISHRTLERLVVPYVVCAALPLVVLRQAGFRLTRIELDPSRSTAPETMAEIAMCPSTPI